MRRVAVAIFMLLLASFGRAQQQEPASTSTASTTPVASDVHFQSVDVTLDPKGQPLAAYQIEFVADAARVKLVGVEGGDNAAFREPPYYDPAALSQHRVLLDAFSTSAELPKRVIRDARIKVQLKGDGIPETA